MFQPRTFSRVGLVAVATFAAHAQPDGQALHCMASNTDIAWSQIRGHYAAFHFLRLPASPESTGLAKQYAASWPTVAGVRHLIITSETGAADWAKQFHESGLNIIDDSTGTLAAKLKAHEGTASGLPVTIVLDHAGNELFRHAGTNEHDNLTFTQFATTFAEKGRLPALKDYNLPKGSTLALEGYDPVSYFVASKPVKGKPDLTSTYRGVTYRFASADNRRRFAQNPEKYLPTYGGWCASAMGDSGRKVEIDPTNYKIKDGRLFLFYLGTFADAKKDWNKREKEWEPAADRNWKKLTNEDPIKP
ncbi:MAG: YHS domain-containing (seleno)protein [Phycisphaerales bacterium]